MAYLLRRCQLLLNKPIGSWFKDHLIQFLSCIKDLKIGWIRLMENWNH